MSPSNIDFTTVTHVIHFALVPQSNGTLNSSQCSLTLSATSLVGLAHNAGRKALVCVGGPDTEAAFMGATTSANLGLFVSNIVNFMTNYGYDGVDLDWEPINTTDFTQYSNLVNGLRTTFNGFGAHKLLTMAAGSATDSSSTGLYAMLATLQGQIDQINLMTYGMSGNWPGWVTWYTSPIYDGGHTFPGSSTELVPSIRASVSNYLSNGVQPGKLGLGVPFYASVWTGGPGLTQPLQSWPHSSVPTVNIFNYSVIMSTLYQSNLYHWDDVAQAAYLSITNTPASNDMFISYDDTHACQAKISYARNLGLGGVMIWELANEYLPSQPSGQRAPLTSAFKQALATPNNSTIQCNGTNVSFNFTSAPLGLYSVQWSSNLAPGSWNTLTNNVAGTGSNVQVADPAPATQPVRFYRVQTP